MQSVARQPSALIPLAMSAAALAVIVWHIALQGTARQADEGTEAHLWQVMMAGQLPLIAYFAISWLPRSPRQALTVLALQVCGMLAAAAPVFVLNW
jgi:hypothetical protein